MPALQSNINQELLNTMISPWRAQCLYAAVKLDIPDLIAEGFVNDAALSSKTGIGIDKIQRLMRFLVASSLFESVHCQQYQNTETSMLLMRQAGPMRDMILLHGEEMYRCWANLSTALMSGKEGFALEYGEPFYAYLQTHPDTANRFQRTMQSRREIFTSVPDLFDFNEKLVVDVGGGSGELSRVILEATPTVKAVVFDLAHMLEIASNNLADLVKAERVTLVQGDMFSSLPEGADVYVLSRILDDLNDDKVLELLSNCKNAKSSNGKILIIEQIISSSIPSEIAALWDLHLMMMCNGRRRTLEQLEYLLKVSGLHLEQMAELPLGMSLLVVN